MYMCITLYTGHYMHVTHCKAH